MEKELFLLLMFGMFAFLLALAKPSYALALTAGANFFNQPRPQFLGAYVTLADVAVVALLLAWILRSMAGGRFIIPKTGLETPLLFLIGAHFLSTAFALDIGRAMTKSVQVVEWIVLLYLTVNHVHSEKHLRVLVVTLLAVGFFEVALGTYQAAHMEEIRRIRGTLGEGLGWPMFMLLLLATVQFATCTELRRRFIWGAVGIIFMYGLLLTQVRQAWISMFLVLLVFGILEVFVHRRPRRFLGFLTAVTVSSTAAFLLLLQKLGSFLTILEKRGLDTLYTRLGQWGAALNIFTEHPWLGIGPGGFAQVWTSYIPSKYYSICLAYGLVGSPEIDAHSFLFGRLAETGLLGMAAGVWVLWRLSKVTALVCALPLSRVTQGVAIASRLLAFLALLTMVYTDFFQSKLFWILMGLGLSCRSFAAGSVRLEEKTVTR